MSSSDKIINISTILSVFIYWPLITIIVIKELYFPSLWILETQGTDNRKRIAFLEP